MQQPLENIVPIEATLEGRKIAAAAPDDQLSDLVIEQRRIVVLKQVFSRAALVDLRSRLRAWADAHPQKQGFDGNGHRTAEIVEPEMTNLVYHAWWFCAMPDLDDELRRHLLTFFEPLRDLQNRLAGTDWTFQRNAAGLRLRPQIIQYPSGAGYFGQHVHPLNPQKLGLIVGMSQQGKDFESGGTTFLRDGRSITLEGHHDIGDIALFRYDLPHSVTVIDAEQQLDWSSERGRWVMVLPIKET